MHTGSNNAKKNIAMPEPMLTLRALSEADAQAFHRLQLSCLDGHPHHFDSSLEEVQQQPLDEVKALIEGFAAAPAGHLLGAFSASQLLGSVALEPLPGRCRAHKARLWGLMVESAHRRRGIARQLCQKALARARELPGVEKVVLELTGEALPALHLYRGLGFRIESVEPMALKQQGRYLDLIRMALYL